MQQKSEKNFSKTINTIICNFFNEAGGEMK